MYVRDDGDVVFGLFLSLFLSFSEKCFMYVSKFAILSLCVPNQVKYKRHFDDPL